MDGMCESLKLYSKKGICIVQYRKLAAECTQLVQINDA